MSEMMTEAWRRVHADVLPPLLRQNYLASQRSEDCYLATVVALALNDYIRYQVEMGGADFFLKARGFRSRDQMERFVVPGVVERLQAAHDSMPPQQRYTLPRDLQELARSRLRDGGEEETDGGAVAIDYAKGARAMKLLRRYFTEEYGGAIAGGSKTFRDYAAFACRELGDPVGVVGLQTFVCPLSPTMTFLANSVRSLWEAETHTAEYRMWRTGPPRVSWFRTPEGNARHESLEMPPLVLGVAAQLWYLFAFLETEPFRAYRTRAATVGAFRSLGGGAMHALALAMVQAAGGTRARLWQAFEVRLLRLMLFDDNLAAADMRAPDVHEREALARLREMEQSEWGSEFSSRHDASSKGAHQQVVAALQNTLRAAGAKTQSDEGREAMREAGRVAEALLENLAEGRAWPVAGTLGTGLGLEIFMAKWANSAAPLDKSALNVQRDFDVYLFYLTYELVSSVVPQLRREEEAADARGDPLAYALCMHHGPLRTFTVTAQQPPPPQRLDVEQWRALMRALYAHMETLTRLLKGRFLYYARPRRESHYEQQQQASSEEPLLLSMKTDAFWKGMGGGGEEAPHMHQVSFAIGVRAAERALQRLRTDAVERVFEDMCVDAARARTHMKVPLGDDAGELMHAHAIAVAERITQEHA